MNRPADYPIEARRSKKSAALPQKEMTYAVLRERVSSKQPVTDEMIRTARKKLDTAHSKKAKNKAGTSRFTFSKLRSR